MAEKNHFEITIFLLMSVYGFDMHCTWRSEHICQGNGL